MTYLYSKNQPIPTNVLEAIKFTGKAGFLSKEIWHQYFGVGAYRWQEKQLKFLEDRGYLKRPKNEFTERIFSLTDKSVTLLASMKQPCVSPVPVKYLPHDSVVAKAMLSLQKKRLVSNFHFERELKTYGIKDFLLSNKDHDQKYPDAIFKMTAYGELRTAAIEYEREQKSSSRYKNILWQYTQLTNLSVVLYICENTAIQKAVERAMKHLGQTELVDRMGYVEADEWRNDPASASIKLKSRTVKLKEICTQI